MTPDGIEGDVPVASEVDALVGRKAAPAVVASQTDLLEDVEPKGSEKATKARGAKRSSRQRTGDRISKSKADQLPLFSAKGPSQKKLTKRAVRPAKATLSRSVTGKKQ